MDLDEPTSAAGTWFAALARRLGMDPAAVAALGAVTVAGLLARLAWLGSRVMHFDEGRVAYWALRAARTGEWQYRYIVHGPLLQHVDRWLFVALGPTDFAARLPVAVVGGLLPLAALSFRDHLRDWEVAAVGGLLAANPVLLYYSRFMRSDLLVAAFALVAFGTLVRLHATRRPRYLYLAATAFALAFASKENAVVYLLCWVGALGLVAGLEVAWPRRFDSREAALAAVRERATGAVERAGWAAGFRVGSHAALAVVLFAVLTLLLYAPRSPPSSAAPGLWTAPLSGVVDATASALERGFDHWGGDPGPPACLGEEAFVPAYLCNLGRELAVLGKGALGVVLLAVAGGAVELGEGRHRVLVEAALYWGVASALGYPLGSDILYPPWLAVHVVVPLAVPAAVGLVVLVRRTRGADRAADPATAAASALVVVLLVAVTLGSGVHHAYLAPTSGGTNDPGLVQYAQPGADLGVGVDAVRGTADGEGVDVLVFDAHADDETNPVQLVDMADSAPREPACVRWFTALPLSWYLYAEETAVTCADDREGLRAGLDADPPVVVTNEWSAPLVRQRLDGSYVERTATLRSGDVPVVFFVDSSRVDLPDGERSG